MPSALRRRSALLGLTSLVVGAAVGTGMSSAEAATISVCATGCDHATVKAAVAAATAGDTITVAAGTFAGEQGITIDKPLTIRGAGVGSTIVDGGGASAGTVPGIFRILPGAASKGSGDIEISGMTLRNPGKNTTASQYFTISIGVKQVTTGIGAITLHDLDVRGTGDVAKTGYGIYADGGYSANTDRDAPDLTITDSTFRDHVYNAVGVDAWRGAVTLSDNDLTEGLSGLSALLVFNEYTPNRITDPVVVAGNTSVGRLVALRNIDNNATLETRGGFDDVTIRDNTVTGLAANDFAGLVSTIAADATEARRMGTVRIHDNVVRGDGTSTTTSGFLIGGFVEDTLVQDNDIAGVGAAVSATRVKGNDPQRLVVRHNRLFADQHGVRNETSAAIDAAENWWGCQQDPSTVGAPCSTASSTGTGSITTAPWVRATATASDDEVTVGEDLAVQVRLDRLSDGTPLSLTSLLTGRATAWTADRGSVAPAAGVLSAALAHPSTYTAPATVGADVIHVAVDREAFSAGAEPLPPRGTPYGEPVVIGETLDIPLTVVEKPVDPEGPTDPTDPTDPADPVVDEPIDDGPDDVASETAEVPVDGALPGTGAPLGAQVIGLAVFAAITGAGLVASSRRRGGAHRA